MDKKLTLENRQIVISNIVIMFLFVGLMIGFGVFQIFYSVSIKYNILIYGLFGLFLIYYIITNNPLNFLYHGKLNENIFIWKFLKKIYEFRFDEIEYVYLIEKKRLIQGGAHYFYFVFSKTSIDKHLEKYIILKPVTEKNLYWSALCIDQMMPFFEQYHGRIQGLDKHWIDLKNFLSEEQVAVLQKFK